MSDAIRLVYDIMLKEEIIQIVRDIRNNGDVDLIIIFEDDCNARRHLVTTLAVIRS